MFKKTIPFFHVASSLSHGVLLDMCRSKTADKTYDLSAVRNHTGCACFFRKYRFIRAYHVKVHKNGGYQSETAQIQKRATT